MWSSGKPLRGWEVQAETRKVTNGQRANQREKVGGGGHSRQKEEQVQGLKEGTNTAGERE